MPSPFGSVRVRTTLAATLLTAGVLSVGSFVIVRLVEEDLLNAAQVTFDHALEEAHSEGGEHSERGEHSEYSEHPEHGERRERERKVLEVETSSGRLLLAYSEREGARGHLYAGFLVDPGLAKPVARIVIARDTLEILELTDLTGQRIDDALVPIDLPRAFVEGEPVKDSEHRLVSAQSLRKVRESVDAVVDALFLIVPGLVLALGVATWFTVGRALRPVHAISRRVATISSSTLEDRVPVPAARDEIAELATLMNQMLGRLQESSERQRQFIADASHELRSPLSTIKAAAEVAQVSPDPRKLGRLAGEMTAEAERMETLISDLLDLARFDEHLPLGVEERVDLPAACRRAVERFPSKDSLVRVRTTGAVLVSGVESQMERAIFNLLVNAVRHARRVVELEIRSFDGRAQVVVDDDGQGVDPGNRDRIFERFVRLDGSRGRHIGGSGIGLSLVKAIAGRHGGSVYATEAPELGGARFVLDLGPVCD